MAGCTLTSKLTRTILRDRNHPSVFEWSTGSEIEWTYLHYRYVTDQGRCLLIMQSLKSVGTIKLMATIAGLESQEVEIDIILDHSLLMG